MDTELIAVHELLPEKIFVEGGSKNIIETLKREYDSFVPDVTTSKGRKEIASFSAKFSRSKTAIDKIGKELKDKYQKMITPIDAERRAIKDACDKYRDLSRKPLTDWELEQKRIEEEKKFLGDWDEAIRYDQLFNREREIRAKEEALRIAEEQRLENERKEKERIELERLQKEREEQIRKDAIERAEREKKELEEKAKREKEEAELRLKKLAEQAKIDAEIAEKKRLLDIQAEKDRAELEKRREIERIKTEQAEKEAAEKVRIEKEAAIEEARILNKKHRESVEISAVTDFVKNNLDIEISKLVVKLISENKISNIFIKY